MARIKRGVTTRQKHKRLLDQAKGYRGRRKNTIRVARQAVEADVHVVGASSLAAGHLTLVPELKRELTALGRDDIMIVVGGVIPPQDYDALLAAGATAIYPPGTVIADAAVDLLGKLNEVLGYPGPDGLAA